jgi:hypothetical protein
MKRFLLLIFALLLLIDLADDGGFGRVTFVAPTSTAETSCNSPPPSCSGKVDCRYPLVAEGGGISCLMHLHPVTPEIQPALKIVLATNTGSAGDIPLKSPLLQ